MSSKTFILLVLALVALSVYLFVQAPAPLPEGDDGAGAEIPIDRVLALVAAENDVARSLYTSEIVGAGKKVGLAFGEDWRQPGVEAGPLPALFLREASASLEQDPIPLGLFLGSDFPISPSNRFEGVQAEKFETIRQTRAAEFFFAEDTGLHTAMFPDFASVAPCVNCHNGHPQSPKKDWVLDDVMGATTWSYPKAAVSPDEMIAILGAVRRGFRDAYSAYLDAVRGFAAPPEIGEKWPREGYYLPSVEVFLEEFARRASSRTVNRILEAAGSPA